MQLLGYAQRRYDNITCVDYGIQSTAAKGMMGVVCIDIPQSTHVMLSYLLWDMPMV